MDLGRISILSQTIDSGGMNLGRMYFGRITF
jgi:hypothetical protein